MFDGLQREKKSHEIKLRSDKNQLRLPLRTTMRQKTWSNMFLMLFDKLPEELREADTRKLKQKRRLMDWVRKNVKWSNG